MKDPVMEPWKDTRCEGSGKDHPCGRLSTVIAEEIDDKGKPVERLELCELCFGHLLFSGDKGGVQFRFSFRYHSQDLLAYFKNKK